MYAPRIIRRRFHWPTALIVTGSLLIIVVAAGMGFVYVTTPSLVPSAIRKRVNFPIFVPTTGVALNKKSFEFKGDQGVLLFSGVTTRDKQQLTFSEQQTPDPFNDIPNYMTQFLQTFFEYQAFDSLQGTVHLTHPKNAGQVVVMNAKGTLVFVRVGKDEPVSFWQDVFNHLTIVAPD